MEKFSTMPGLRSYIKHYRKKGYSDEQIRNHLLSQGYPSSAINKALKPRTALLLIIILLILLLVISASLFWVLTGKEEQPIEIKPPAGPTKPTPSPTQPTLPPAPISPPIKEEQCPNNCNDFDICTKDECILGVCQHHKISPCCGNLECEFGESLKSCPSDCKVTAPQEATKKIIDGAVNLAKKDITRAANICRTLPRNQDTDRCIRAIAEHSNDSRLCGQITNSNTRDSCYLDFALEKDDFSVCGKIIDHWLKQSCFSYENLHK